MRFQKGQIPWNKGKSHLAGVPKPWKRTPGPLSASWKGGKTNRRGYTYDRGVRENRLVMQGLIGRLLTKKEIVHHWDEVKTNNQKENLCLMRTQAAHKRLHHFARRHGLSTLTLRFDQPWLFGANA